jgi:hypothetical protein
VEGVVIESIAEDSESVDSSIQQQAPQAVGEVLVFTLPVPLLLSSAAAVSAAVAAAAAAAATASQTMELQVLPTQTQTQIPAPLTPTQTLMQTLVQDSEKEEVQEEKSAPPETHALVAESSSKTQTSSGEVCCRNSLRVHLLW